MAKPRQIDWDAQPLGEMSDKEIAKRLKVTVSSVYYQRRKKNISIFPLQIRSKIDWDAQPLGKLTDPEIAKRIGVTTSSVAYQRKKRGITATIKNTFFVRGRIDWDKQPLGKISDNELSFKLKTSRSTIRYQRIRRGIPPFVEGPLQRNIDWDIQPLGKVPDRILATKLRVAAGTVTNARLKRKIPVYSEVGIVLAEAAERQTNEVDEIVVLPTINTTKEFEVTIRIRNNCLKQRRLELGHETLADFSRAVGISKSAYGALENMSLFPKGAKGDWRPLVLTLAEFHGCSPEDLFPPAVMKAQGRILTFKVDDEVFFDSELKEQVEKGLILLTPREEKVLRMRFGLNKKEEEYTLDEIAKNMEVTRERVRQIEKQALRKIEYSSRKDLKEFWK